MKNLKLLLLLPLLVLAGCEDPYKTDTNGNTIKLAPNFYKVCEHSNLSYIRDDDTNLMYIYYTATYHTGISPYYNEEGKVMTYDEFLTVHTARYH